ncbi:alpha/beta fold hydrolase [Microlunatus parietis]|uniref:Alpha-beta hydrolase superfamily lysophospholipase n=1 Tax=Microlunatus parietis TaxID=682979 RepID=A0A7Y9IA34_9ACTN|nr:alpha/beta hydrolase [Microlunatus parietis]NYE72818.1 alpha-beta hydrolase superfamily lysophospholipase [Microlunatus parietis]
MAITDARQGDLLLIPGADGRPWFWHRLVAELDRRGCRAVAADLPKSADSTLDDYADAAAAAAAGDGPWIVVAQSLGAFTAPLLCTRLPVERLALVNPMIPSPGETAGDWWEHTGQGPASAEAAARDGRPAGFELVRDFFHDVPPEITEQAFADAEVAELGGVFAQPWPLRSWPAVPTQVIQGADDRFFPLDFQRRVVRDRLGLDQLTVIPGGHLNALSRPAELADALLSWSPAGPAAKP